MTKCPYYKGNRKCASGTCRYPNGNITDNAIFNERCVTNKYTSCPNYPGASYDRASHTRLTNNAHKDAQIRKDNKSGLVVFIIIIVIGFILYQNF